MVKLTERDIRVLNDIILTAYDELLNDQMAETWNEDYDLEEKLVRMLNDHKRWSIKVLANPEKRKLYISIIKNLTEELRDVRNRIKTYPHGKGALGFVLGRDTQKDGNARDTDNKPSHAIAPVVRSKTPRVYGLGGQTKHG